MVIQHMVKPAMHKGCISVHFCLAKEAFYSWIGRPMRTDEKLIYQRIRRVTINPRPRMKSSKQVKTWTKQNYTRKIWIRLGMLLDFLQNLKTCLFGQFSRFVFLLAFLCRTLIFELKIDVLVSWTHITSVNLGRDYI